MRPISTDRSQNLKQKVIFVCFVFVFILFLFFVLDYFESAHVARWHLTSFPSNNVNASLVPILARQSYSRLNVLRLQFFRTFSVVFNCRSLFNEAAHLAVPRRLRSPFAIRDANSKQSKTKIYDFFCFTFCCGFRYGPHLMIVMIFVTQNNF